MADDPDHRDPGGRFGPGNPGRRKGSRNKATLAAEAVLESGARAVARKAVALAKAGDVAAIRLVLERLVSPRRDRPAVFELPSIESLADHPAAMASIMAAVADGDLTPADAEAMARVLSGHREALAAADLERRVAALEEASS